MISVGNVCVFTNDCGESESVRVIGVYPQSFKQEHTFILLSDGRCRTISNLLKRGYKFQRGDETYSIDGNPISKLKTVDATLTLYSQGDWLEDHEG